MVSLYFQLDLEKFKQPGRIGEINLTISVIMVVRRTGVTCTGSHAYFESRSRIGRRGEKRRRRGGAEGVYKTIYYKKECELEELKFIIERGGAR